MIVEEEPCDPPHTITTIKPYTCIHVTEKPISVMHWTGNKFLMGTVDGDFLMFNPFSTECETLFGKASESCCACVVYPPTSDVLSKKIDKDLYQSLFGSEG